MTLLLAQFAYLVCGAALGIPVGNDPGPVAAAARGLSRASRAMFHLLRGVGLRQKQAEPTILSSHAGGRQPAAESGLNQPAPTHRKQQGGSR